MFTLDLFGNSDNVDTVEQYGVATFLYRGFALVNAEELMRLIQEVEQQAPFRHMVTPAGYEMSVAMTNCGDLGWISGAGGAYNSLGNTNYRYDRIDPKTGQNWPEMPPAFLELAQESALKAGFQGFNPDSCIVNRYAPGARLGLHQDSDEFDFSHPVVSVSLGLPATFLLGGNNRNDPIQKVRLEHGDVIVWGGKDRMRFHGIEPVKDGYHPLAGSFRYNLSIRHAG